MSHELKTPLAAATARIGGLVEAGGSGEDVPARVREEAAAALADLARLDGAIGDLLDMSQLESDAWRPRFEPCDVSDVLGTVLAKLPEVARGRVRFELAEGLPPVTVDFAQVARALANLVENALTYSGPSEPVIIGARTIGPDVVIWVEDRGPGVPDAEKRAVFEKFHRGSASAAVPGTGLGLTIAAAIVRAHGGRVWVEDAVPRGARFMVTLRAGERVMSGGEGE
ncbi:MAG: HAMP domain-containing histidine kinase [Actinobacteria bacterium]|nr:MAG: HAMP domain-containing histidine kinase [Actinomycetota bacterium]